jgi:Uma2 family endonuclease
MVITEAKPHSLEAFLGLPETKPASEFINNKISQKTMPQGKHSRLQTKFSAHINQVVEELKIAYALQNYVVPSAALQLFLIFAYFVGSESPVILMDK